MQSDDKNSATNFIRRWKKYRPLIDRRFVNLSSAREIRPSARTTNSISSRNGCSARTKAAASSFTESPAAHRHSAGKVSARIEPPISARQFRMKDGQFSASSHDLSESSSAFTKKQCKKNHADAGSWSRLAECKSAASAFRRKANSFWTLQKTVPRIFPGCRTRNKNRSSGGSPSFVSINQDLDPPEMGSRSPGRGSRASSGSCGAGTLSICRAKNGGTGPIAFGRSIVIVAAADVLMKFDVAHVRHRWQSSISQNPPFCIV